MKVPNLIASASVDDPVLLKNHEQAFDIGTRDWAQRVRRRMELLLKIRFNKEFSQLFYT